MTTDAPKTLLQRLHAVMGEVDYVQKEKKAGMRYSIVSHDAVTAKVRPLLHKHGIIYYPVQMGTGQDGNRTTCDMAVRFVNVDDAQDYIDVRTFGYGVDDQDKGPGKAMSYAVKYALLKALGLETGDDPDTDQEAIYLPPGTEVKTNGKAASRVTFDAIQSALRQFETPTANLADLQEYWKSADVQAALRTMHPDFKDMLTSEKEKVKQFLSA